MSFGAPHRHYLRVDSTNTRAKQLAEAGAPHGAVVTAAEQTEGRGRQGRAWTAPPGKALLYSAILRSHDKWPLLPLAAAVAVCEAAEALAPGVECGVKWPNDVHLDNHKLAGVLIEARPQDGWAVIGIGLNLTIPVDDFPPALRATAISLFDRDEGGRGRVRGSLPAVAPTGPLPTLPIAAAALSRHLDRWTTAEPEEVLDAWRARDVLRGREIAWGGGSGVADGVDDGGNLRVVTLGGDPVVLGAGEVHLTRA
jgi:BirA family biotin operon repressor/biotin-[acetyl-CoA-carboxylase] ligase